MDSDRFTLTGSSATALDPHPETDEECVADDRSTCTPSEMVQQKLRGLVPSAFLPASGIHTGRVFRRFHS